MNGVSNDQKHRSSVAYGGRTERETKTFGATLRVKHSRVSNDCVQKTRTGRETRPTGTQPTLGLRLHVQDFQDLIQVRHFQDIDNVF